jgi:hypothetical protein
MIVSPHIDVVAIAVALIALVATFQEGNSEPEQRRCHLPGRFTAPSVCSSPPSMLAMPLTPLRQPSYGILRYTTSLLAAGPYL